MTGPANILTFDIEGFIEASHDSFDVPERYISAESERKEIEVNTTAILELLRRHNQKATFFILGRIAGDMPSLVRKIAGEGHEVACHGLIHRRIHKFDKIACRRMISDAKNMLEDVSGRQVVGFRAPDFSITKTNLWAFDILRESGFLYDSSVYPIDFHDVYGVGGFTRAPFRMQNGLVEIPMSTAHILGKNIPFGGGGYLRLYPFALTKFLFSRLNTEGLPGVVYLHPFEMGDVVTRIREISNIRKFRTYYGISSVKKKLSNLLRNFSFTTAEDYLKMRSLE
ncbi:MAG: polysaccharide deacetylase family protein [Elusimicrobia bacterium HGW-Elusimicrobia-1]|jgi:polysaccharide deacetylase family protein (PEP-CTERM system associated)|nr:MAG: polysaccharide deacetylase family protein [Elusimicrobia bacterium HGW-Elusimicrobia-1]